MTRGSVTLLVPYPKPCEPVSGPRNLDAVIPWLYAGARAKLCVLPSLVSLLSLCFCNSFLSVATGLRLPLLPVLYRFSPVTIGNGFNAERVLLWLLTFSRDGNDGAWSSFTVQVGTPPQAVRLLPSITGNSIWAVWSYGCGQSDDSDCPSLRGNLFNISASSTWKDQGNYSLPLNPEHYLPYTGAAAVGFDNITV
jgi:hypothetical protein